MKERDKRIVIYIFIIILIILDQICKEIIENSGTKYVINKFLTFNYFQNTGVAFGFGYKNIFIFIFINIIILGIIAKFIFTQSERLDFKSKLVISLVMAGRNE